MALGLIGRWAAGWGAPLWFDETFSGVIASQRSFAAMIQWCLNEVTGPGYYGALWLWEKLAGSSNDALRLPSYVLSAAAPLLLFRYGHGDRNLRCLWAVFAALWVPGLAQASEARAYAEIFLLACVQAMFFLHLMEAPRLRWAMCWSTISVLLVLTHYFAIPLAGLQGIAFLVRHRGSALRLWPALLPLLPMAGWMMFHLSVVMRIAGGSAGWYQALPLTEIASLPRVLFGSWVHGGIVIATVALSAAIGLRRRRKGLRSELPVSLSEAALALTGGAAFLLIFALGFVWPSFAPRYLTPTIPAVLFGLALWATRTLRRDAKPVAVVVAMFFIMAAGTIRAHLSAPEDDARYAFNLERPSDWLMQRPLDRLIFLWDSPLGDASRAQELEQVGGFFFARVGRLVPVEVVRVPKGADPARTAFSAAAGAPGTGILWLPGPRSADQPRLQPASPNYICRDFGRDTLSIFACLPQ